MEEITKGKYLKAKSIVDKYETQIEDHICKECGGGNYGHYKYCKYNKVKTIIYIGT